MINVTANAAKSIGLDSNDILNQTLRNQFKLRFDVDRCDQALKNESSKTIVSWLSKIIPDPHWRQTLYDLFVQYPESDYTNFAILKIFEGGYSEEVSQLRTSTKYLKVFDAMVSSMLDELIGSDDTKFDDIAPRLEKMCCGRQDLYMYTQILLKRLESESGDHSFSRVTQLLEKSAVANGNKSFVDSLKSHQETLDIAKKISTIITSQRITEADVTMLKAHYSSDTPPPVKYLCNFDLINRFLRMLYVPHNGSIAKNDIANNIIYLIAYATNVNDNYPMNVQKPKIAETQDILKNLYVILSIKTPLGCVSGTLKYVTEAIKQPVAAVGVLLWIEYMALETSYFETYFRTTEKPALLIILDAISSLHKLQHPVIFGIIKRCIKHKYPGFAPEIQMTLQKFWADCLLYLVQLNYVLPVLKYIADEGAELDASVTNYFVKRLLALATPPYSVELVEHVLNIVDTLGENLALVKDAQAVLKEFFNEVLSGPFPIKQELKQKMESFAK
ncbi:TH1 protein [Sporodiniella umbellata]|nr:TH1 protein [Sporodiniella umbellata]